MTTEEENAIITVREMPKHWCDMHGLVSLVSRTVCPEEDLGILQVVLWGNPEIGKHLFRLNWQSS